MYSMDSEYLFEATILKRFTLFRLIGIILCLSLIVGCKSNKKYDIKVTDEIYSYADSDMNYVAQKAQSDEVAEVLLLTYSASTGNEIKIGKKKYTSSEALSELVNNSNDPLYEYGLGAVAYHSSDISTAKKRLTSAKRAGILNAIPFLFRIDYNGETLSSESQRHLKEAISSDHYKVISDILEQINNKEDMLVALSLLIQADTMVANRIAALLYTYDGTRIGINHEKAEQLYRKAIEAGDRTSEFLFINMLIGTDKHDDAVNFIMSLESGQKDYFTILADSYYLQGHYAYWDADRAKKLLYSSTYSSSNVRNKIDLIDTFDAKINTLIAEYAILSNVATEDELYKPKLAVEPGVVAPNSRASARDMAIGNISANTASDSRSDKILDISKVLEYMQYNSTFKYEVAKYLEQKSWASADVGKVSIARSYDNFYLNGAATKYFKEVIDEEPCAAAYIGEYHVSGAWLDRNSNYGLSLLQDSLDNGCTYAHFGIGKYYEQRGEKSKAVHHYGQLIDEGDLAGAVYYLNIYSNDQSHADRYLDALLVAYDGMESEYKALIATEIAYTYYTGLNTSVDYTKAKSWFEVASTLGNEDAKGALKSNDWAHLLKRQRSDEQLIDNKYTNNYKEEYPYGLLCKWSVLDLQNLTKMTFHDFGSISYNKKSSTISEVVFAEDVVAILNSELERSGKTHKANLPISFMSWYLKQTVGTDNINESLYTSAYLCYLRQLYNNSMLDNATLADGSGNNSEREFHRLVADYLATVE